MQHTDAPRPSTPHLPDLLRNPQLVERHVEQLVHAWALPLFAAISTCVAAYAAAGVLIRARRNRAFADGARVIDISAPPEAALAGGQALWANLLGLHRPRLTRLLHGQPHLGFEYRFTGDGHAIRLWIPRTVPPGLVEHAVEAAWPGARTLAVENPVPPLPLARAQATGGRLVPARGEAIPLRTKHDEDPLRALFGAVADLKPGEAACVQILARPASTRRARKLRGTLNTLLGKPSGGAGLKTVFFDAITPHTGPRPRTGTSGQAPWRDPRTDADARAAATKLAGPMWETIVRYGASVPHTPTAHGRTRGLAHAVAGSFNVYAERNHLRRKALRHPASTLDRRPFGRGALLSVPELAALAHLPADLVVPGLARAGARPVPPNVRIPSSSTETRPVRLLGDSDAGPRRAIAIPVADARHHLHVIGATGSGKSTLLGNLVLDDVKAGRGAVVIDPKGDLVADLLDRLPEKAAAKTVLFDPEDGADPPRINMFDGAEPDVTVDNLVGIFKRIYSGFWGPRTDDLLRAACLTLVTAYHKNPGFGVPTLAHVPGLLTSDAARRRYVSALNDQEHSVLKTFWDLSLIHV
ncbi:type IV secretion system DNA-binding domain-containing protein, partial [Actinocrinis puniceicyclus]